MHDIPLEKAINVREELMKFHQKWYSANIMCLAVFGKESLDELEKMIVELFSQIHNKDIKVENWGADPFLSQQMSTKTFIIPVKDTRSLTISFMTPDLDVYYKAGPEHYISHLIGHEGRGSVLSELKLRGWCNNLVGGHSNTNKGFGFFEVMVDLTEEGMEHTDDIIEIIFNYINLMKKVGPLKWIFDEYRSLSEMQFRFKDKENPLALVSIYS